MELRRVTPGERPEDGAEKIEGSLLRIGTTARLPTEERPVWGTAAVQRPRSEGRRMLLCTPGTYVPVPLRVEYFAANMRVDEGGRRCNSDLLAGGPRRSARGVRGLRFELMPC